MHRRPSLSVVTALAAAAGLSTMVAMSAACGSIDCTENGYVLRAGGGRDRKHPGRRRAG
jgi:hypothetical protein